MADFSKQYCEKHDSEMPSDFDILEIADGLQNEYYTSMICEGFGFIAIGKNASGEVILAFPPESMNPEEPITWKSYEEVING